MRRRRSIQWRLINVFAIGALAMATASTLAILALRDLGRSFEEVSGNEVPGMVAGLDLARFAATIEGRSPSLIAAENGWERYRLAALLEQDFQSLNEALQRFKRAPPSRAGDDLAEIDSQAATIRRTLDEMKGRLTDLAERQAMERLANIKMTRAQDDLRQSLVPTLLALTGAINGGSLTAPGQLTTAIAIRDPLIQCERLLDATINTLLQIPEQRTIADLVVVRGRVERLFTQIDGLSKTLPIGIRDSFDSALRELRPAAGGADGMIRARFGEIDTQARLANLVETNRAAGARLNFRTQRVLTMVEQDVDQANARITASVASQTALLILIALASILLASGFSYSFVVRDLGHNLHAVTEAMMRLAAGERDVSVPATRRDDELGALARAFSVFRDNAEALERMDHELRETSEHLLVTFTNMSDGFSVFDTESRLVTANAKFRELYDLPERATRPGTSLADILAEFSRAGAAAFDNAGRPVPLETLNAGSAERVRQYEIRTATGRIVELRGTPTPRGFATVHTDRTQRKAMEEQLLQAQKTEMVGRLTGGVAHDFNNILAVVAGNLHLQREALTAAGLSTERLDRAMAAVDRATTQIDRMLSYARRQTLKPRLTDVGELIGGMLDLVTVSVGPSIDVTTETEADLSPVMIDPAQMENALLNLAVNARDAMPDGGRLVLTACRRTIGDEERTMDGVLPPGDYVEIAVGDSGTGMPPEVLARAAEPFFTTKPRGRGSGLGLSMVYGFVKQSGGELRIESRPGLGTRVALFLPAASGVVESGGPTRSEPAPTRCSVGGRILLVEDSSDLLEVNAALLRGWGYEALTADRAPRALRTLDQTADVRLVLTDIDLKEGMDGTELVATARARRPDLMFLLTSAHSIESLESTASHPEELTRWPFIRKPATPDTLARLVREAMEATQSRSTSASKT